MQYTTLIPTSRLADHLIDRNWAIVDCRFSLVDTSMGRNQYADAHIPGAVYAHLDEDLSGAIVPGRTGRHPLPIAEDFAGQLSAWGIDDEVQVVAYDGAGGSIASRMWWLLRWLGHDAVAVLDGGWRAWQEAGLPTASDRESRPSRRFHPKLRNDLIVTAEELSSRLGDPDLMMFDARGEDRYRGENETLDPRAGHIPGARPAPFAANLESNQRVLPADQLRRHYEALLGETPAQDAIFYCGSGVTAALDLLALVHAGLGDARLYAGSWSEWITDTDRPTATGMKP